MNESGEHFLHKKESSLHISPSVEHEMKRRKVAGEEVSQKPEEKIANWMKVLQRTHLGHRDNPEVLGRIKEFYLKEYIIKLEDIPESYFDNQRKVARERGYGDIKITEAARKETAEVVIADQRSTLDNWIDYLTSPDSDMYPMWAKYWAFRGMVKLSTYDKEKHVFSKRDNNTVAPFIDLDREALSYVMDAIIKSVSESVSVNEDDPEFQKLLQGANFGKLYAWAIEKVTPAQESELRNIKGEWVKYDKGSDPMPLVRSLEGHGTGWCTAGENTAKKQLGTGDFYVFYSYDRQGKPTIPRITIRMEEQRIAEVRGIADRQNFDPYIASSDVLAGKLEEFGQEGKKYQKRSADMKQLTDIEQRVKQGMALSKDDLRFLYEIDSKIEGFGYGKDPRVREIIATRKDTRDDLAVATGFKREEISFTKEEALRGSIKYHYGNLDLEKATSAEGLCLPEFIHGNLILSGLTSVEGLTLPQGIGGNLDLRQLKQVEKIILPYSVGGYLNLISLISAGELTLPQSVGGDLLLENLEFVKEITLPQSVGGNLNLSRLKLVRDLTFPGSVGGHLLFNPSIIEGNLIFPRSVGRDCDVSLGSPWSDGLARLKKLILPQTVGRDLHLILQPSLNSLVRLENLDLPMSVGGKVSLWPKVPRAVQEGLKKKYPHLDFI